MLYSGIYSQTAKLILNTAAVLASPQMTPFVMVTQGLLEPFTGLAADSRPKSILYLLCRFALSQVHPLLGYAAQLEGTDFIRASVTSLHMHLPSEVIFLRLEPLKVRHHFSRLERGFHKVL